MHAFHTDVLGTCSVQEPPVDSGSCTDMIAALTKHVLFGVIQIAVPQFTDSPGGAGGGGTRSAVTVALTSQARQKTFLAGNNGGRSLCLAFLDSCLHVF